MTRVRRPPGKFSVDRGRRDRGDPDPNYAQFPSGDLSRSTIGDTDSSNALVQRSNRAAVPRPRGCVHHVFRWFCRVAIPPFRLHVGTSIYRHQHAPVARLQKTKAPLSLSLPLLSFQIVDSRFLLSFRQRLTIAAMRPQSNHYRLMRPGSPPGTEHILWVLSLGFRYSSFPIDCGVSELARFSCLQARFRSRKSQR
jgi:hypothetical protein